MLSLRASGCRRDALPVASLRFGAATEYDEQFPCRPHFTVGGGGRERCPELLQHHACNRWTPDLRC